jgi:hypothetical protein
LAVGSSQLPWAQDQLAQSLEPVKGLAGLGRDSVSSKDASSRSDQRIRKLGTVVASVRLQRGDGDAGEPAGSIGRRLMAGRNARPKAGSIDAAAQSADSQQPMPLRRLQQRQTSPSHLHRKRARASAHQASSRFFSVSVPVAKCTSCGPSAALVNGFAALHVVRLCAESSNENDAGANADNEHGAAPFQRHHAGPELVDEYFQRVAPSIELSLPAEEEGAGGLGPPPGSPVSFLQFLQQETG